MSEDMIRNGHGVEIEQQDLRPSSDYAFLTGLAIAGVLIYFILWGMYHALDAYSRHHQPAVNPLVQPEADTRVVAPGTFDKVPGPRLETNERLEINDFRLKEEQRLNSYGWVDQQAGIVHIPIERAMQLVEQRGLLTTPKVGTAPPSEVGTVEQAAHRSDVSNLPASKEKKKQ
jgi:hypothetical protein